jgi:hypothetical protein
MARDLIHLTSEGYRQSAALLASKIGWGVVGDARRISAGCVAGQVGAGDPDSRSDCLSAVHRTVVGDGGI